MLMNAFHNTFRVLRATGLVIGILSLQGCAQLMSDLMLPAGATAELNHFDYVAPQVGMSAPGFALLDLQGKEVRLDDLTAERPLVLAFASYTCPVFRERFALLDELATEFDGKADFAIVYTVESHPANAICPYTGEEWDTVFNKWAGIRIEQHKTIGERRAVASRMAKDMGIELPILVDDMDNMTWRTFGAAPASAFLIDRDKSVRLRQVWFEPRELRDAITTLVAEGAESK